MKGNARKWLLFLLILIAIGLGTYLYLIVHYKVTKVTVNGSTKYNKQQIMDFVMTGRYGDNALYLMFKYRDKPVKNIPFIERLDVHIENETEVNIDVYEKAVAGYISYLDRYMYFDKDGIIVESSLEQIPGIPYVTGLEFNSCVMHEPLPVENAEVFKEILEITQLLTKYSIVTDRIYFSADGGLYLYFGDSRASLGTTEHIDEKMIKLKTIIPELNGRKGTLHMESFTEDSETYITFEPDQEEPQEPVLEDENEEADENGKVVE